jgi:transposase
LPACYPHWNTVHRYHLAWSRDGTWEQICDRIRAMVREQYGRDSEPSASVIDARSVRGASTVTASTRGYDAGKKISRRKTFGVVDTLGLTMPRSTTKHRELRTELTSFINESLRPHKVFHLSAIWWIGSASAG